MNDHEINDIVYTILLARIDKTVQINQKISKDIIKKLTSNVIEVFQKEPNLLYLSSNINIVGDIHGNIDDLIRIFERNEYVPKRKYLFLGDYVDRGENSIDVLILLFCLKIKYPEHIFMICGNHETSTISRHYGFYNECCFKYDKDVFDNFIYSFRYLPFAAIINDSILCLHGGISSRLKYINDINKIQRPFNNENDYLLRDIVWSDPNKNLNTFFPNTRGCGTFFGRDALNKFLEINNLKILIRSHEFCKFGYCCSFGDEYEKCYTVFSTSNYCGKENIGPTISIEKDCSLIFNKFSHLNEDNIMMRRLIFPDWLIISKKLMFIHIENDFEKLCSESFNNEII